ncbi:MAG: aldehyde dehydrogenase family protein, partial [Elusimicrobia bacterium]|nr:aldehyde dehydrogenase family protein [Elusimicrobiota bacterium]
MNINEQDVSRIVREVITKMGNAVPQVSPVSGVSSSNSGLYDRMGDAIAAAKNAQKTYVSMGLSMRRKAVKAMREVSRRDVEPLARLTVEETGMGRVDDKVTKILLAADKTPGVEDIQAEVFTGDGGLTLVERGPFGVIGAVTPSTNPAPTIINNAISILAAGNSVVFAPHPAAKQVSLDTINILNEAIISVGGPANLITAMKAPSLDGAQEMFTHPDVKVLIATGGPGVVKVIMQSGKKVIAAGPGNPPVVVDSTADSFAAADAIIRSASFDNGVLCTAEKEVLMADGA